MIDIGADMISNNSLKELDLDNRVVGRSYIQLHVYNDKMIKAAILDAIKSDEYTKENISFILRDYEHLRGLLLDVVKEKFPQYEEDARKMMVLI